MTNDFSHDVLVVGAGAAGLTLAVDLARRGVDFRLIEKASGPFQGSRGKGIQPRTQEILEDLGVVDRLFARGGRYPVQRVYDADGGVTDKAMMEAGAPTPTEPYHSALMAPQFATEGVLRDRLAELGHVPAYGYELTGFRQDAAGVEVTIVGPDGPLVSRVRYLIAADGGRSPIRMSLDIPFPGETLGVRALVADVQATGVGRDAWHSWQAGTRAQISLCPLAGTDMFQLQAGIPLEGDVDLSAEGLTALLTDRIGRPDVTITEVFWASPFNMSARLAGRYREGRGIFLVGDAAHIHPPTGGQGLNTSAQDAYNLGWKLAAVLGGAPDALLDTYETERREIAASMLGMSTRLLEDQQRGETRRGREVQQLDLGYPADSLGQGSFREAGLQPGQRAPDAPLVGAAGLPVRLFDLMKGPHHTLIVYDVEAAAPIPAIAGLHVHRIGGQGDYRDSDGVFQSAYGVTAGDWVLIRPDGYVGAVASAATAHLLRPVFGALGLTAIRED